MMHGRVELSLGVARSTKLCTVAYDTSSKMVHIAEEAKTLGEKKPCSCGTPAKVKGAPQKHEILTLSYFAAVADAKPIE